MNKRLPSPSVLSRCAALLALAAIACEAAAPSLEEQVRQLAGEMEALRKENRQLRADLGLEGPAAQPLVRPAGRESTLTIGGLLQAQADLGDKGDARFTSASDRFYLRRARLNLQGGFLEKFDFRLEAEFAGTLGEGTGLRAQLTDAYINWTGLDQAHARVGQFKTPFGFEQLSSDPRLLTIERTLANDRLTAGRQIGLQIGGDLLAKRLTYATGIFNGTGVNTSANDDDRFLWAGRIGAIAWQDGAPGRDARWSIGANALASSDARLTGQPAEFGFDLVPGGAADSIFAGRRRAGGLDTQFHAGRFDLMAEYLRVRFEPRGGVPAGSFEAEGWYAQAAWFVLPKRLQSVVKCDFFDPNRAIDANSTRTWTFGVNCLLKGDDLKLQCDYLLSDIDARPAKERKLLLRLQTVF